MLNDIQKAWIKKQQYNLISEKDHQIEAAAEMGIMISNCERRCGLSFETAFELAKAHFIRHGQAMIDVAKNITLEMLKEEKNGRNSQDRR